MVTKLQGKAVWVRSKGSSIWQCHNSTLYVKKQYYLAINKSLKSGFMYVPSRFLWANVKGQRLSLLSQRTYVTYYICTWDEYYFVVCVSYLLMWLLHVFSEQRLLTMHVKGQSSFNILSKLMNVNKNKQCDIKRDNVYLVYVHFEDMCILWLVSKLIYMCL